MRFPASMPSYSKELLKSIENRINSGSLKVSGVVGRKSVASVAGVAVAKPSKTNSVENLQALGRMKSGQMNKTEAEYAQYLEALKACGEVLWWKFEAIKLRLADNTFYTPDFFVMKSNGELEAHEVKGYMLDDANVKIKVASGIFPFKFFIVKSIKKKNCGEFSIIEV